LQSLISVESDDGKAEGLTGQYTFNAAIVCGGKNDDNTLNTCFEYKQENNTLSFIFLQINLDPN